VDQRVGASLEKNGAVPYVSRGKNAHNRITAREEDRSGGLDPLHIGIFLCELIAHRLAGLAAYKFNQE
jgi:hypothetical protein